MATPNVCQLFFETDFPDMSFNLYRVIVPATFWTNGTHQFVIGPTGSPLADTAIARYYYHASVVGQSITYVASGLATAGSFTLSGIPATGGLATGASFDFVGTSTVFTGLDSMGALTTMAAGSGGDGSTGGGVLSDPTATTVNTFDGKVHVGVHYMGINSSLTIGAIPTDATNAAYAICSAQ